MDVYQWFDQNSSVFQIMRECLESRQYAEALESLVPCIYILFIYCDMYVV